VKRLLLGLMLLASAAAAAQVSACYTCPYQKGVGAVCSLTLGQNGACTCEELDSPPNQMCHTTGTCVIGEESCGSVGGGGGDCTGDKCDCGDGTCDGHCCTNVQRKVAESKKLDAEFQKIREDWSSAPGDDPIRVYLEKACNQEELERRYKALAMELGKKVMIFVTEEKDFNITKEEKLKFLERYHAAVSQGH
jgi:hypothetical protein